VGQILLLLESITSPLTLQRAGLGPKISPEVHYAPLAMAVTLGRSRVPLNCIGGHWFLQRLCIHEG